MRPDRLPPRGFDEGRHSTPASWLRTLGVTDFRPPGQDRCAALGWAASGAMELTGPAAGPPCLSPAPAFGLTVETCSALAALTDGLGTRVAAEPGAILAGRAAMSGYRRAGRQSAGGASRLLRTADGWCAVTLSRSDDLDMVSAIIEQNVSGDPWRALEYAAARGTSTELADRAQLLGVPAAALPEPGAEDDTTPWQAYRIADPLSGRALSDCVVVDLSSMWAGPLCTHLLGRAGAAVIKVESTRRPDGARADRRFFEWLHTGQEFRQFDFRSATGRARLAELIDSADIVIEASRPRALAQLGLGPDDRPHPPGRIWLSLTGYGRSDPMRVAFGDDAAVAGGLVGWYAGEPVFCADAVADPLTGLCAALAVTAAVRSGGGMLIDMSMRAVAAAYAAAPPLDHGPHQVISTEDGWAVECAQRGESEPVRPPSVPDDAPRAGGS